MHCAPPEMVCETKIVAEDHDAAPGGQKKAAREPLLGPAAPRWPGPPPDAAPARDAVCIREFHPGQQETARRIFYEGIMERIPNTAFRGLKDQPLTQLVYGAMAVVAYSKLMVESDVKLRQTYHNPHRVFKMPKVQKKNPLTRIIYSLQKVRSPEEVLKAHIK